MAFAISLKKLANRGIQTVYEITSMDRPGRFKTYMQQTADDAAPLSPPMGVRGWFPVGVDKQNSGLHAGQVKQIKDALAALDPAVDAQWTPEGLPTVEAVVAITGDQGMTRAMIAAVAPEFTRAVAEELRAL